MNRFDEEWPEESFAIFKEVAGRIGTTIRSSLPMAAIKLQWIKSENLKIRLIQEVPQSHREVLNISLS